MLMMCSSTFPFIIHATLSNTVGSFFIMGCQTSQPVVEVVPPEPLPSFQDLKQEWAGQDAVLGITEPYISGTDEYVMSSANTDDEQLMIFRKIGHGDKGESFNIENMHDQVYKGLQIHPAKPGFFGIQNRLEDLVVLLDEHDAEKGSNPYCYAMKNVAKGLNHYVLFQAKPFNEKRQQPVKNIQCPLGPLYHFALVEFDIQAKVGRVLMDFHPKGETNETYTLHQCNPKVWVIKKRGSIVAVFNKWRGLTKTFTCYRMFIRPGTDVALISLFAHCIDSFMEVAKGQMWKLYPPGAPVKDFDFPPLDQEWDERLFGRNRWWLPST